MNRFKKLVIENFQSHEYTEIDFSQGLNVFVGPSDSGKSAILRALRWVLFNQPRGTDFIRAGASQCRVSLTFTDGTEVARIRNKNGSINRYILRLADGTEQVFEGFGNQVPHEITQIHQIASLKLDSKELYVQFGNQLESPFLLFESNQNKAKTIGRISGAHLIDNALKKASSDQKSLQMEMKRLEQERGKLEEQLKPYENLPELEQRVTLAEQTYINAESKQEIKEQLEKYGEQLQTLRLAKKKTVALIEGLSQLPKAEALLRALEQKSFAYRQFVRLNEKWRRTQAEKEMVLSVIECSKELPEAENQVRSIERKKEHLAHSLRLYKRWMETVENRQRLLGLIDKLKDVPRALEKVRLAEAKINQMKELASLAKKWEIVRLERQKWEREVDRLQQAGSYAVGRLGDLERNTGRLNHLKQLHEKLQDVQGRIQKGKRYCADKEAEMARLAEEWVKLLKERGKCPTCSSVIDQAVLEKIMEEYQGGISRAAAGRENQTD